VHNISGSDAHFGRLRCTISCGIFNNWFKMTDMKDESEIIRISVGRLYKYRKSFCKKGGNKKKEEIKKRRK